MNKKILIHALGANMGGAMRHLTNFLPELGKQDANTQYTVLVRESFPEMVFTKNIQLKRIPDKDCSSWIRRILSDVIMLPFRLKRENFSAIVSLTNFGPIWTPIPHVFFQRNALYYCPYYLNKISRLLKIETLLRRSLSLASMKRATLIVTPSDAMGGMICNALPQISERNFHTLYHGFDNNSLAEPLDDKFLKMLASKKGVKFLFPTHPGVHKGFDILFHILTHLKTDGVEFSLFTTIERNDWPDGVRMLECLVRDLGLINNVVFMGRVPQRQMGGLYEQCDLMIYPSLCESFGFSMIEAMGYGLPIVAAETAINKEMCGDCALYYPPFDSRAGASVINEALLPEVSLRLRERAAKRIASFDWSWKRYAKEFIEMLENVK